MNAKAAVYSSMPKDGSNFKVNTLTQYCGGHQDKTGGGPGSALGAKYLNPIENTLEKPKDGIVLAAVVRPGHGGTSRLWGCFFKIHRTNAGGADPYKGKIFFGGDTYGPREYGFKLDIARKCDGFKNVSASGGSVEIIKCADNKSVNAIRLFFIRNKRTIANYHEKTYGPFQTINFDEQGEETQELSANQGRQ